MCVRVQAYEIISGMYWSHIHRRMCFRKKRTLNFVSAFIKEMILEDSLAPCLNFPGRSAPAPRNPSLPSFIPHMNVSNSSCCALCQMLAVLQ